MATDIKKNLPGLPLHFYAAVVQRYFLLVLKWEAPARRLQEILLCEHTSTDINAALYEVPWRVQLPGRLAALLSWLEFAADREELPAEAPASGCVAHWGRHPVREGRHKPMGCP